jgi:hypothetical protein
MKGISMQQPESIDPRLQNELESDEQLLWWGRPNLKFRANALNEIRVQRKYWIILFFLLLALVADVFSITLLDPIPDPILFGVTVILAVLLLKFLRIYPIYRTVQRNKKLLKGTLYAITNRRAMIITVAQRQAVASHSRREIGRIERIELEDGWGDVVFGVPHPVHVGARTLSLPARFAGIPDVHSVEMLLLKTFKNVDVDLHS